MSIFQKIQIGLPLSTSTAENPLIDTSDSHTFTFNPYSLVGSLEGGKSKTTIGGKSIFSQTTTPKHVIQINWAMILPDEKYDVCDYYFKTYKGKLVYIDDQAYAYEVTVVPESYKVQRLKPFLQRYDYVDGTWEFNYIEEPYSCSVSLLKIGSGLQGTIIPYTKTITGTRT